MSITSQIAESTFRIEVSKKSGASVGTGFLYSVREDDKKTYITPILVTNKHVVEGGISGTVYVTVTNEDGSVTNERIEIQDFEKVWRPHPDAEVDLTAVSMGGILNQMSEKKMSPRLKSLSADFIPTAPELDSYNFVEDVMMVGYPIGIWDKTNNYPLFRRGITASHAGKNFNGKAEFVIDIAAFPGSSGSPVFLLNEGSFHSGGSVVLGTRVKLLGVLHAGPQFTATGEIVVQDVPTSKEAVPYTAIPANLGYVISSQKLRDFEKIFPA